jgi:hypothetical protein
MKSLLSIFLLAPIICFGADESINWACVQESSHTTLNFKLDKNETTDWTSQPLLDIF